MGCAFLVKAPLTLHVNFTCLHGMIVRTYSGIWLWCAWMGVELQCGCHPLAGGADTSNSDVAHLRSHVALIFSIGIRALALKALIAPEARSQ